LFGRRGEHPHFPLTGFVGRTAHKHLPAADIDNSHVALHYSQLRRLHQPFLLLLAVYILLHAFFSLNARRPRGPIYGFSSGG
jgi:hypothetical protein